MAKATKKKTTRRKKAAPEPTGLRPSETRASPPSAVEKLRAAVESDGGTVHAAYREPLGGHWVVLAVLPTEQVQPTPYQRKLSDPHVKRLADAISRMERYLDPVIAFRTGEKTYQVPNGYHRMSAMKSLGARSITALVVTDEEVARRILALNVEKAHSLRERASEVIRLAEHLAEIPGAREADFSFEFEEPALLTLGLCYEERGRFAGGAYHPIIKRVDAFLKKPLAAAIETRRGYAAKLLSIDDRVSEIITELKEKGLESPYLRNFVVARINPIRFRSGDPPPIEDTLEKMARSAEKFDAGKISTRDVARTGGAAAE